MISRSSARIFTLVLFMMAMFALHGSIARAQVDPVQIYPLPGQHTWTAIPGSANMDQDSADEIVLVDEDSQLVIVDAANGQIQFDSGPYGWNAILVPGWEREGTSEYYRNHGYDVFCDEDGDGIYCVNLLVSVASPYEYQLAVICLNRGGASSVPSGPMGSQLDLRPSFPNPLKSTTRIGFSLTTGGRATVRVFDTQGRLVRTLMDKEIQAGEHSVDWDGRNDEGRTVANGMYYYELDANGERTSRKAIMLR